MFRTVSLCAGVAMVAFSTASLSQPISAQRVFDDASQAFNASNWPAAAAGFEKFRQLIGTRTGLANSVAQIREGHARLKLGQVSAALPLLEAGAEQAPDEPSIRADRLLAFQDLAMQNEGANDVALAASYYGRVSKLADESEAKLAGVLGYARNALFSDPDQAIEAAQQVLARTQGQPARARTRAIALDIIGRAHLIAGRPREAVAALQKGLVQAGGLTTTIDSLDASIRANLAMAALLTNDDAGAHKYLATSGMARGQDGLPPPKLTGLLTCSGRNRPEDYAIYGLSLDRTGKPAKVHPIFVNSRGMPLKQMATYLENYLKFDPVAVARIHPLQASTVRVELHCAEQEIGEAPLIKAVEPLNAWLASRGVPPSDPSLSLGETGLAKARQDLTALESRLGKNAIELLPVLGVIAESELTDHNETTVARRRQLEIVRTAQAPLWVIASSELRLAMVTVQNEAEAVSKVAEIAQNPTLRSNPEAMTYLAYSKAMYISGPDKIKDELVKVAGARGLADDHPLKRAANAQLFYYETQKDIRRNYLRRAKLSANPCRAARVRAVGNPSASYFPTEALRWGFEGWVVGETDIGSSGKTTAFRPVLSYPPLVFTAAAKRATSSLRFEVADAIIPAAGCAGNTVTTQFRLPKS